MKPIEARVLLVDCPFAICRGRGEKPRVLRGWKMPLISGNSLTVRDVILLDHRENCMFLLS